MQPLPSALGLFCLGEVLLAVVAFSQLKRTPQALRLGLFALSLFPWTLASTLFETTGAFEWHIIDAGMSPLTPPLGLTVALEFSGQRRKYAGAVRWAWLWFGALALISLSAFVVSPATAFITSAAWDAGFGLGLLPLVGLGTWVLFRHWTSSEDATERSRAGLFLSALLVMSTLGATEPMAGAFPGSVPRLGAAGGFFAALLLTVAVLRFGFSDGRPEVFGGIAALALAGSFVTLVAVLVALAQSHVVLFVLMFVTVAVGTAAISYRAFLRHVERRERLQAMLSLGRMSSQMAHDLKNPLAALKGAAQLLLGEYDQKAVSSIEREFAELIVAQANRLQDLIERYQRLGRMELHRTPVDINALVQRITEARATAEPGKWPTTFELDGRLTPTLADEALLTSVFENIIGNSLQAMPQGGSLHVCTYAEPTSLTIEFHDKGPGMDARALERAGDDFFTTKAQGSGLGLSFSRRVMAAHHGSLKLESAPGRGTTVRLVLPRETNRETDTAV